MLPFFLAATFIITAFAILITIFLIIHKQRQVRNKLDKQQMEFHYRSAMLHTRIEVQEQALQMVSQEIHDNLGQVLSFTRLQLATLREHIPSASGREILDENLTLLRKSIKDLRLLSHSLNTGLIETRELEEAIRTELERIQVFSTLQCNLESVGTKVDVPPACRLLIFRIAQEALQNILKHSQASRINVLIEYGEQDFVLRVSDNGIGLPEGSVTSSKSLGMTSMNQRASMLEGTLSLTSQQGEGTTVQLTTPITFSACQQPVTNQYA